jgi:hypothetical protein
VEPTDSHFGTTNITVCQTKKMLEINGTLSRQEKKIIFGFPPFASWAAAWVELPFSLSNVIQSVKLVLFFLLLVFTMLVDNRSYEILK